MWCDYDEDLNKNSFFKEIRDSHSDLIEKSCEESWIICVPRTGTYELKQITFDNILDHVLVPNNNQDYSTLSKKQVVIKNRQINIETSTLFANTIPILFEETFYMKNIIKYTVWCIDRPLFVEYNYCDSYKNARLQSVHDCIDFLWTESLGHEILNHIQILCQKFIVDHEDIETESLQSQRDLVGVLYSQCLQITFKNVCINEKSNQSQLFLEKLKVAVETYMQHCLGKKLMDMVNTLQYQSDSFLNKITRNSEELQLSDLGISNKFSDIITNAKGELCKINHFVTILDKISCLKCTFNVITENKYMEKFCITSDDLLQILVFLILKLNINNWTANLIYLKEFRLSYFEVSDENSFLITTLEAALKYIRSNEIFGNKDNLLNTFENKNDTSSVLSLTDYVFNKVRLGHFEEVKYYLLQSQKPIVVENSLCHPLCSCHNCEYLLQVNRDKSNFNINSCNDIGQNLLIFASIFGHSQIVEYLLNEGLDPNETDCFGKTALHYACSKGFQDIVLLLINSKADVNIQNNEKNSSLHVACNSGHDNCVKGLIYSSHNIKINICNNFNETPLHLASKWGYLEIVQLLLENGASTTIRTKRKRLPLDLAANYYVFKCIEKYQNIRNKFTIIKRSTITSVHPDNHTSYKDSGFMPKNSEQHKKVELLLKAIENNDLPLTCFYLGFTNSGKENMIDIKSKCHPLCICDKCSFSEADSNNICNFKPSDHISVNLCDTNGFTPLHMAAKFGCTDILRLLLDCRALVNVKTYKTLCTPLHIACIYQKDQIVKELLKCGECNLDEQDAKGYTALHYACLKNNSKIVEILISNDADCSKRNCHGKTALQVSEEHLHYKIFKMLKDILNNSINALDNDDLFR